MIVEYIQTLYSYNTWANARVLNTVEKLDPNQLLDRVGASFGSIRDTLVHTMSAQWMWHSRWQGVSPPAMLEPAHFRNLASIRNHWDQVEANTQTFVAGLDSTKLKNIINYQTTEGQLHAFPLWQLMVHQVNHATQHRSEVAVILTEFGHSPGWLDFIMYLNLNGKNTD